MLARVAPKRPALRFTLDVAHAHSVNPSPALTRRASEARACACEDPNPQVAPPQSPGVLPGIVLRA